MNLARAMGTPPPRFLSFAEPPPSYKYSLPSILMTKVLGIELDDDVDFDVAKYDLVRILALIRSFSSPWGRAICGVDGGPVVGPLIPGAPLHATPDEATFYDLIRYVAWFDGKDKSATTGAEKFFALPPHAVVFTHEGLNRHNVMVGPDSHITGIIDWEAAWLPDYWEVAVTAIVPQHRWGQFMNETVTASMYAEEVLSFRRMFSIVGDCLSY